MVRISVTCLALATLAACSDIGADGRQTFITREKATVYHTGVNGPFEVRFQAGWGVADYWCAAGRFTESQGLPGSTRIYRLTPTPRPQGSSVSFTFSPPGGGAQPTGVLSLSGSNDSLSSTAARDQCTIVRNRNEFL